MYTLQEYLVKNKKERLCSCGQIQTETHVIENCPISLQIRQSYNVTTAIDLLLTRTDHEVVCQIVHKLLSLYWMWLEKFVYAKKKEKKN